MKCPCRAAGFRLQAACCSAAAAYKLHWYSCSWLLSPLLPRSQDINHSLHLGGKRWWAATGELQGMGGYSIYGALGCRMDKLLLTVVVFLVIFPQYYFFLQKCLHFQKRIFRHAVGGSYKHLHFFFCSCLATGNQCCRCNCIMLQCCRQSYQKCSKMNCKLSFDCAKYFGSVANLLDSSVVFVGCCSNLNRLTKVLKISEDLKHWIQWKFKRSFCSRVLSSNCC